MIWIYISILINIFQLQTLNTKLETSQPYILILGIAQDGGYPHAGCQRDDCQKLFKQGKKGHLISCIAIVDPASKQSWMIDATPDFPEQLEILEKITSTKLAGIFLTHAHIGHYTGLMHLGREVIGAKQIPVYAMPKMKDFLEENGPWSQLVSLQNIIIQPLAANENIKLTKELSITPFLVPHRDEYSETVGYQIESIHKKAIFIPDINKWNIWERDITKEIQNVNIALLDGSFYQNGEIPGRNMSEIPHPFVQESMELFKDLSDIDKAKVHFIHINHTNPLLHKGSAAQKEVKKAGFKLAQERQRIGL
ncbi:MAG: MBL fold metallo-hydrolase [Saprospiraceae bacterium]|nr:MBL fold metallo-hydrolase [Saprospiraceae bacterium]